MQNKITLPEDFNYIGVFLTFDCPRRCSYCLNNSTGGLKGRGTIGAEEWISSLNRIETGLPITFNGGEPLAHPGFFSILNGFREEARTDLLTTLPYDVEEFIASLNPERFQRDLPYSAIRVTYHPETMDLEETVRKVKRLKEAGFDVNINLVDHPQMKEEINVTKERVVKEGIGCVVKPFLGHLDGELFGQYKYPESCAQRTRKDVECRTTNLLIDPMGDVYRCHRDMFSRDTNGRIGNIADDELNLGGYTSCSNFGFCHPCDVQIKFDRFGGWGYTAANIIGEGIERVESSIVDWR